MRDELRKFHIRTCVRDALSRHGIANDSPLRARLGNSLDTEIENWLGSQRLAGSFPTGPRTIAKSDIESVRDHFADIAAGTVRVS